MPKTIKAYLIDPYAFIPHETGMGIIPIPRADRDFLTEVTVTQDNIEEIYAALTCEEHEVTTFDAVAMNEYGDTCFVDDEGLFHGWAFFRIDGYDQPLAGRGLILGTDSEGRSTDPHISFAEAEDLISLHGFRVQTVEG
jgi:hypothetical protein